MYFDSDFIKNKLPEQAATIVSDSVLAPNRWQAIVWINNGLDQCIYASLRQDELRKDTCLCDLCYLYGICVKEVMQPLRISS